MKWLDLNSIHPEIKKRVSRYFDLKWTYFQGFNQSAMLADVPETLKRRIDRNQVEKLVSYNKFFENLTSGAVQTIITKLQNRLIPKDEFIVKQGEVALHMFFVLKGEAHIITEDGYVLQILNENMSYGEFDLLNSTSTSFSLRRYSIIAKCDSLLGFLTLEDFQTLIDTYPDLKHNVYTLHRPLEENNQINYGIGTCNKAPDQEGALYGTQVRLLDDEEQKQLERVDQRDKEVVVDDLDENQMCAHHESINNDLNQPEGNIDIEDLEQSKLDIVPVVSKDGHNRSLKLSIRKKSGISQLDSQKRKSPRLNQDNLITNRNLLGNDLNNPRKLQFDSTSPNQVRFMLFEMNHNVFPYQVTSSQRGLLRNLNKVTSSVSDLQDYFKISKPSPQIYFKNLIQMFLKTTLRRAIRFCIVFYNIIFIPLQMGFDIKFDGVYLAMEIITILIYLLDLLFKLRFYIQLKRDIVKLEQSESPKITTDLYNGFNMSMLLKNTKFDMIITALAILPFSWILQDVKDVPFILNFLRVLRLVHIKPFYQAIQLLKRINVNLIRIFEVIITYYLVAHIVSGVMLQIALSKADIRLTWINRLPVPLTQGVRLENNLDGLDWSTLYIHALYFTTNTISHVAIGDITTVSTEEKTLNAFLILMFTFFYAFCFANIAQIVSDFLSNNFLDFHERFNNLKLLIDERILPQTTKKKVEDYYDYLWETSQGIESNQQLLEELPFELKYDILISRFIEAMDNSLILKNEVGQIDLPFVNSLVEQTITHTFMPGEFILRAGSHGSEMIMILDGEAQMLGLNEQIIGVMRRGAHYHNHCEESEQSENTFKGRHIVHIVAKTITVVGIVQKDKLDQLYRTYPYWQQLVTKLNKTVLDKAKEQVSQRLQSQGQSAGNLVQSEIEFINKVSNNTLVYICNVQSFAENTEEYYKKISDSVILQTVSNQDTAISEQQDLLMIQLKDYKIETGKIQQIKKQYLGKIYDEEALTNYTGMLSGSLQKFSMEKFNRENKLRRGRCSFFSRIYFNKNSRARKVIDFLHLINLLYIAIAVPFQIAFINIMDTTAAIEILSIILQILIIYANFRTPIIIKGHYTLKPSLVYKNYLNNGLIYDILGMLPLNLILGYVQTSYPSVIIITIVRLTRMIAIAKLLPLLEKFEAYMKNLNILMFTFKAFAILFLLWHWTASWWYFMNHRIEEDLYDLTWIKTFNLNEKTTGQQYLLSIYFVIKIVTGVGQSDMIAYNNLERVIFMIIINIGDALFAFAFGMIASIELHVISNNDQEKYRGKMDGIEAFLVKVEADKESKEKVLKYFQYVLSTDKKQKLAELREFRNYLPESLAKEIAYNNLKGVVQTIFWDVKSDNFIREVVSVFTLKIFINGDAIYQKTQSNKDTYYIVEGIAKVYAEDKSTLIQTLMGDNYFGDLAFHLEMVDKSHVIAASICPIQILRKADLDPILLKFPQIAQAINDQRLAQVGDEQFQEQIEEQSEYQTSLNFDEQVEKGLLEEFRNRIQALNFTQSVNSQGSSMRPMRTNILHLINQELDKFKGGSHKRGRKNLDSIYSQLQQQDQIQSDVQEEDRDRMAELKLNLKSQLQDFNKMDYEIGTLEFRGRARFKSKVDGDQNETDSLHRQFEEKSQRFNLSPLSIERNNITQNENLNQQDAFEFRTEKIDVKSDLHISRIEAISHKSDFEYNSSIKKQKSYDIDKNDISPRLNQKVSLQVSKTDFNLFTRARASTQIKRPLRKGSVANQMERNQILENILSNHKDKNSPNEAIEEEKESSSSDSSSQSIPIRRRVGGKGPKCKRRLSRVSMGRSIILNTKEPLKLQWAVGNQ